MTNEQRYDWLTSQEQWHARRSGKWHKSQARFYRKAIRSIPGLLGIIISRTVRKHSARLVENITRHNTLLSALRPSKVDAGRANHG
jgi:hypothetical protein